MFSRAIEGLFRRDFLASTKAHCSHFGSDLLRIRQLFRQRVPESVELDPRRLKCRGYFRRLGQHTQQFGIIALQPLEILAQQGMITRRCAANLAAARIIARRAAKRLAGAHKFYLHPDGGIRQSLRMRQRVDQVSYVDFMGMAVTFDRDDEFLLHGFLCAPFAPSASGNSCWLGALALQSGQRFDVFSPAAIQPVS